MSKKVNVFLPMRAGSDRVLRKNTRAFSGVNGGLCRIKIKELLKCKNLDRIIVSTDDPTVVKICNEFCSAKIQIVPRPHALASSIASTDDLIKYVPEIMPKGHILWTHVTSPFITSNIYDELISEYFKRLSNFDSLMTVTKLQKFIWNDDGPFCYDREVEKWPRTQTISPLWEVNSGAFLASKDIYLKNHDRIGDKPYLFELDQVVSFDIDWLPDFEIAEKLYAAQQRYEPDTVSENNMDILMPKMTFG